MAPFTRVQKAEALDHVLDNVLDLNKNDSIIQSVYFSGIQHITGFVELCMDPDAVKALRWEDKDKDGNVTIWTLPPGQAQRLINFAKFVTYKQGIARPDDPPFETLESWKALTSTEYDKFTRQQPRLLAASAASSSSSLSGAAAASAATLVDLWNKGIKRNRELFPTMTKESQWENTDRRFRSEARAQGCELPLDSKYKPKTQEEVELFDAQQKYVYNVMQCCYQTDHGKKFVREHDHDYDAQKVYESFKAFMEKTTVAKIDAWRHMIYIITCRLADGSWRGPATGYVRYFEEQVRLYDQIYPSHPLHASMKLALLQNSVEDVPMLAQVKTTGMHLNTQTGHETTYVEYVRLLLSACATYDRKHAPKTKVRGRTLYYHECATASWDQSELPDDFGADIDDDLTFETDMSVNAILVFAAERSTFRSRPKPTGGFGSSQAASNPARMAFAKWKQLSPRAQAIWDSLDDADKAVILMSNTSNPGGTRPARSNASPFSQGRATSSNVHQMTPYEALAHQQQHVSLPQQREMELVDTNITDDAPPMFDASGNFTDQGLLALMTRQAHQPQAPTPITDLSPRENPANIRNVLSTPETPGPQAQLKPAAKKTTRFSISMTVIEYAVSLHAAAMRKALADRGANGTVIGSDMRIIFRVVGRSVDITGLADHKVNDTAIVCAGGVVRTQLGEVIVILNQAAYLGKGKTIISCGQMEHYGIDVDDKSVRVGGKQRIKTPDGYVMPLELKNGLPFLDIRPYTDEEFDQLPHVVLTSDAEWDPRVLDYAHKDDDFHDLDDSTWGFSPRLPISWSWFNNNWSRLPIVMSNLLVVVDGKAREIDASVNGCIGIRKLDCIVETLTIFIGNICGSVMEFRFTITIITDLIKLLGQ